LVGKKKGRNRLIGEKEKNEEEEQGKRERGFERNGQVNEEGEKKKKRK
jgi:hypothetical protein